MCYEGLSMPHRKDRGLGGGVSSCVMKGYQCPIEKIGALVEGSPNVL